MTNNKKDTKIKNLQELKVALKEAKDELFTFRMEKAQNKLKNTRAIFLKRKGIARILTDIRQKEMTTNE